MGFGLVYGSCVVSVVLYKRDGIGSDEFDPSEIERVFRIPSLRSWNDGGWHCGMWDIQCQGQCCMCDCSFRDGMGGTEQVDLANAGDQFRKAPSQWAPKWYT